MRTLAESAGLRRWLTPLALLALFAYAIAFQGSRGLWSPDEGRYTEASRQMLVTGDYLHPRLHHEHPHYTKPPLTYWALAASQALFGQNEWAIRLPNAIAFGAVVLLVLGMARRLVPARPWAAALVYATMLLPYEAANAVTTDTLLTLAMALYAYAFLELRAGSGPRHRWLLWFGVACAFMVKGPPGWLPLAGLLLAAWHERAERPVGRYFGAVPMLVATILAFAWYAKIAWDDGAVLRYFLVEEVYQRVATGAMKRNSGPLGWLYIYLPTLVLGTLPWSSAWWPRVRAAFDAARRREWFRSIDSDDRFLLIWTLVPLFAFCLARSRLPFYLLGLFVPIALGLGRAVGSWSDARIHRVALASGLVLIAIRFVAIGWHYPLDDRALAAEVRALGLPHIGEIAFLDDSPRYGLGHYLGVEIERLTVEAPPAPGADAEYLAEELKEPEGCRLWLIERWEVERFIGAAARTGATMTPIGNAGPFDAFVVADADCPGFKR